MVRRFIEEYVNSTIENYKVNLTLKDFPQNNPVLRHHCDSLAWLIRSNDYVKPIVFREML